MFDKENLKKKVVEFVNADYHVDNDELLIVPDETIETNYD
jgi:hypothetical protein